MLFVKMPNVAFLEATVRPSISNYRKLLFVQRIFRTVRCVFCLIPPFSPPPPFPLINKMLDEDGDLSTFGASFGRFLGGHWTRSDRCSLGICTVVLMGWSFEVEGLNPNILPI